MKRSGTSLLFVLSWLLAFSPAEAQTNVCSSNSDGRIALCAGEGGQCMWLPMWQASAQGTLPADNPGSACCYDPDTHECGAGAILDGDDFVTPMVSPKRQTGSSQQGTDLEQCGMTVFPDVPDNECTYETSCAQLGFEAMCPFTRVCTNDTSLCPEYVKAECEPSCGGVCYNGDTHFCFEHQIYSKQTHFKCGGNLYVRDDEVIRCCSNQTTYDPGQQGCCSGGRIRDLATESCCGTQVYNRQNRECCNQREVYDPDTQGCCGTRVYVEAENDCRSNRVVCEGCEWSQRCATEFNPSTHTCVQGKAPFASWGLCAAGESYALRRCYVPGSAGFGQKCASDDQCVAGKCTGIEGLSRGECVCRSDADCGPDQYCKRGAGAFLKNTCENLKGRGRTCGRHSQCASDCCKLHIPSHPVSKVCRPSNRCS